MSEKKSTVTLLIGDQDEENTNFLIKELAAGFESLGFKSFLLRASSIPSVEAFCRVMAQKKTVLIISMAGVGLDMNPSHNMFNACAIPVLTYLLDHPLLYWDRVNAPIVNNPVSCLSQEDCDFILRYKGGGQTCFALPHGASQTNLPEANVVEEKRDIDLFFCATLRKDMNHHRKDWNEHGTMVARRLDEIVEQFLSADTIPLSDVVFDVLQRHKLSIGPLAMYPYYVTADQYLRDYYRIRMVEKLACLPLSLAGPGWEGVMGRIPQKHSIRYYGRIDPQQVLPMMRRSKIVLNAMAPYHVSHERVFSAMAQGAVACTSQTAFYETFFNEQSLLAFCLTEDNLADKCFAVLDDDNRRLSIARAGYDLVQHQHSWSLRAEMIVKRLQIPCAT